MVPILIPLVVVAFGVALTLFVIFCFYWEAPARTDSDETGTNPDVSIADTSQNYNRTVEANSAGLNFSTLEYVKTLLLNKKKI